MNSVYFHRPRWIEIYSSPIRLYSIRNLFPEVMWRVYE
jgi:hypothetical protein